MQPPLASSLQHRMQEHNISGLIKRFICLVQHQLSDILNSFAIQVPHISLIMMTFVKRNQKFSQDKTVMNEHFSYQTQSGSPSH